MYKQSARGHVGSCYEDKKKKKSRFFVGGATQVLLPSIPRQLPPSSAPLFPRKVVVLPECWNGPYDTASFPVYAEPVPEPLSEAAAAASAVVPGTVSPEQGPSTAMLCRAAVENKVWIVGGSVPEAGKGGGVYNTCVVVDPKGRVAAKHRKVHLFDIDVPGGITFK